MQPKPPRKKSYKALIITLVSVFVVFPMLGALVIVLMLPSLRLCSSTFREGQEVTRTLDENFTLLTYRYDCLTANPTTTDKQRVTTLLTSTQVFGSQTEFRTAIAHDLQGAGWVLTASENAEATVLRKDGFTTTIESSSYQPALGQVLVKPDVPTADFGFVFEKSPNLTETLPKQDRLRFLLSPVYTPDYVPAGYTGWSVDTDSVRFNGVNLNRTIVNLDGGTGSLHPSLYIVPLPDNYDITHDCNSYESASQDYICNQIGMTSGGVGIYLGQETPSKDGVVTYARNTSAVVGDHLIYFMNSYKDTYVSPQPSIDEIVQVYETLKLTNTPAKS